MLAVTPAFWFGPTPVMEVEVKVLLVYGTRWPELMTAFLLFVV